MNKSATPPRATASPEEAAAIAAAIEQFLVDTATSGLPAEPPASGWLRAGLREGVGLAPADASPWGERETQADRK